MIKKILLLIACLFFIIPFGCIKNSDNKKDDEEILPNPIYQLKTDIVSDKQYTQGTVTYPNSIWETPNTTRLPNNDKGNVKAFLVDSVNKSGSPIKVFCFLGLPEHEENEKVPGIVLVHGGGGTAFYDWVKMWNDRGYAAVAMDTEGCFPTKTATLTSGVDCKTTSNYNHSPANNSMTDSGSAVTEQWMYYATSSVISCTSFLLSQDCVDSQKVGITGISWGAFMTSIVTGYDDRLAFSIPVYGCIGLTGTAGNFGNLFKTNTKASGLWDDMTALKQSRTPTLFVDGSNDDYFTVDAISKCSIANDYCYSSIQYKMTHNHDKGSSQQEIYSFADYIVGKSEHPITKITKQPTKEDKTIEYNCYDGQELVTVYYTEDSVLDKNTYWVYDYLTKGKTIDDILVDTAKYFYVNITDFFDNQVSSVVVKL